MSFHFTLWYRICEKSIVRERLDHPAVVARSARKRPCRSNGRSPCEISRWRWNRVRFWVCWATMAPAKPRPWRSSSPRKRRRGAGYRSAATISTPTWRMLFGRWAIALNTTLNGRTSPCESISSAMPRFAGSLGAISTGREKDFLILIYSVKSCAHFSNISTVNYK